LGYQHRRRGVRDAAGSARQVGSRRPRSAPPGATSIEPECRSATASGSRCSNQASPLSNSQRPLRHGAPATCKGPARRRMARLPDPRDRQQDDSRACPAGCSFRLAGAAVRALCPGRGAVIPESQDHGWRGPALLVARGISAPSSPDVLSADSRAGRAATPDEPVYQSRSWRRARLAGSEPVGPVWVV
jgi:hypothetical protein